MSSFDGVIMEIKNYAELQKMHEHFESLFRKSLAPPGKKPARVSAESQVTARRAALAAARTVLATAERKHATLVKRAEAEVAALREAVARLEGEAEGNDAGSAKKPKAKKQR